MLPRASLYILPPNLFLGVPKAKENIFNVFTISNLSVQEQEPDSPLSPSDTEGIAAGPALVKDRLLHHSSGSQCCHSRSLFKWMWSNKRPLTIIQYHTG